MPAEPSSDLPASNKAAEPPPPVEGGKISGWVSDFDGNALVGVRVEAVASGGGPLDLLPTMSDGEGRFLLEGLADGRYDLRFELGRVKAQTLAVPTGTDQLRVRLARPQGILLVIRTGEGQPTPDLVHVLLERHAKRGRVREYVGRHLKTRMLLWSIRPGTYTVTAWGGPYLPVQATSVKVREKEPAPEVQLVLGARGGAVRGRVVEGSGVGVADALLAWRRLDQPGPWPRHECNLHLDQDGRFVLRGLPAGTYLLTAGRVDGHFVDASVEVAEEGEVDLVLALP